MDIRFAYWVPNVSGGLVVSKIPQRTNWTFDYLRQNYKEQANSTGG